MSLLFRNVELDGATVNILVEGDRIAAVGAGAAASETLDCRGGRGISFPGDAASPASRAPAGAGIGQACMSPSA
jgi:hypothetical protein